MIKENIEEKDYENFKAEAKRIWEDTNHKYIPIFVKKKDRSKLESLKKNR